MSTPSQDRPHRVLMIFSANHSRSSWEVVFRKPPMPRPLRTMHFADPDKFRSLYQRFGAERMSADLQVFEFEIRGLPPGELVVYADWWASGSMQHHAARVKLTAGQRQPVELVQVAQHKVAGTLTCPSKEAETACFTGRLKLSGVGERTGWHLETEIAKDGSFSFPLITDGEYLLQTDLGSGFSVSAIGKQPGALLHLRAEGSFDKLPVALQRTSGSVEGG